MTTDDAECFVTVADIFDRMLHVRKQGHHFCLRPLKGSYFSQLDLVAPDGSSRRLLRVYTGSEPVYESVRAMFHEAAKRLCHEAKSQEWVRT